MVASGCASISSTASQDGRVLERRFNIGEKLEDVVIERRPYQYLYEDQSGRIFMNQETFEQIPIDNELVIGHEYMKESDIVEVVSDTTDGTILYAEMPVKTVLRVTHSEPGIKGRPPLHQRGRSDSGRYPRRFLPPESKGVIEELKD